MAYGRFLKLIGFELSLTVAVMEYIYEELYDMVFRAYYLMKGV